MLLQKNPLLVITFFHFLRSQRTVLSFFLDSTDSSLYAILQGTFSFPQKMQNVNWNWILNKLLKIFRKFYHIWRNVELFYRKQSIFKKVRLKIWKKVWGKREKSLLKPVNTVKNKPMQVFKSIKRFPLQNFTAMWDKKNRTKFLWHGVSKFLHPKDELSFCLFRSAKNESKWTLSLICYKLLWSS